MLPAQSFLAAQVEMGPSLPSLAFYSHSRGQQRFPPSIESCPCTGNASKQKATMVIFSDKKPKAPLLLHEQRWKVSVCLIYTRRTALKRLGWLHCQLLGLEVRLQPCWETFGMLRRCRTKQNDTGQRLGNISVRNQRWTSVILLSYC